jgi:hypothetical protein
VWGGNRVVLLTPTTATTVRWQGLDTETYRTVLSIAGPSNCLLLPALPDTVWLVSISTSSMHDSCGGAAGGLPRTLQVSIKSSTVEHRQSLGLITLSSQHRDGFGRKQNLKGAHVCPGGADLLRDTASSGCCLRPNHDKSDHMSNWVANSSGCGP